MSKDPIAIVQKNDIKLSEHIDSTFNYEDKFFLQAGCVGFYLTKKQLRDIYSVINYYINADDIVDIKVTIGGEHVSLG